MPSQTPPGHDPAIVRIFLASAEGQDVLLGAIAYGFGVADNELAIRVSAVRREIARWSTHKRENTRRKIDSYQIDVIGAHGELKGSLCSLANALLVYQAPAGRSLEIGKILFAILDADVDGFDDWKRDAVPILAPMGCSHERMDRYVLARLPS